MGEVMPSFLIIFISVCVNEQSPFEFCIRIRAVSKGWVVRMDIAPATPPAMKSLVDDIRDDLIDDEGCSEPSNEEIYVL